jgi:hypothetical protein
MKILGTHSSSVLARVSMLLAYLVCGNCLLEPQTGRQPCAPTLGSL